MDRCSPLGGLGGAGRLPPGAGPGRQEAGHQRRRLWFGTQGEGLASHHHPAEEEGEAGSRRRVKVVEAAGLPLGR